MNILDIRYIDAYKTNIDFDGDFDGGSYTLSFHYTGPHSVHEKIEYTLRPSDYEELLDGLENLLGLLKGINK